MIDVQVIVYGTMEAAWQRALASVSVNNAVLTQARPFSEMIMYISHYSSLLLYISLAAFMYYVIWRVTSQAAFSAVEQERLTNHLIVIPCHDEARALEACLLHYAKIIRSHVNVRFLLLLSNQQSSLPIRHVHSIGTAYKNTLFKGKLQIVECPKTCDTKAKKIEHLFASNSAEIADCWIVLTDVDALPVKFGLISQELSQLVPTICQAVPLSVPSVARSSILARGLAQAQAERSIMELWALSKWNGCAHKRPFVLGVMGASAAFNYSAAQTLRPWPANSDDIRIGYRADYSGVERFLWRTVFVVGAPLSINDWLRQNLRIAEGVNTRLRESLLSGLVFPNLCRAYFSMLFDWIPCIRLGALLVCLITLEKTSFTLPLILICVITQVHLQHSLFKFINTASESGAHNCVKASAIGAFSWPLLRFGVSLTWRFLSPQQKIRIMARPTPK
jgi:Glycosyl transferase family group 2